MSTIRHVKRWIKSRELLKPGTKIIAAVSGGSDSVALLVILNELADEMHLSLSAAHFDHGIRTEAARERKLVERLASRLGVPLIVGTGSVPAEARKRKKGIEETARLLRHRYLEKVADQLNADAVALGHTKDDQVETILHHIIRGTGWRGIAGIPARRGIFIRPLLTCSRASLAEMLRVRGIRYAVDRSNFDSTFVRNRIRNRLLPYLRRNFNPSIDGSILRLGENIAEGWEALEKSARHLVPAAREDGTVEFPLNTLERLSEHQLYLVLDLLLRERFGIVQDIEKHHYDAAKKFIVSGRSGSRIEFPYGVTLERDQVAVRVIRGAVQKAAAPEEVILPRPGVFELASWGFSVDIEKMDAHGIEAISSDREAFLASVRFPVRVRTRKHGDKMIPFGMKGRKKLSDLFIDRKVPIRSRDSFPVFEDERGIFWVPGIAADERTRITSKKRTAIHIRISSLKR
jgi:tRNA(Ile)-lysidine synthase